MTADRPLAVTSFPGMDVVHLRFTSRRDSARLSASYVAGPPVPVAGDTFLQLEVGPTGASPQAMPRHLEAPTQAAITEIVPLPDRHTWIIGLDGPKRPLTTGSRSYGLPQATGSAELIALPHPQ